MSIRPTIVLVHGFWGGAAHWAKAIVDLHKRGFESIKAVENPLTSLADDVSRTQQMIKQVDGPVLLVGHSYGGAVITEAGELPNVAGLVYVAAFAPGEGESVAAIGEARPAAAQQNIAPDRDGYLWIKPDKFQESFCQDLPDDEALVMAVTQKAPVASTAGDRISVPAWKTRPAWYQISSEDRMIHPDSQRAMASRMNPRKVIELASSHASLASHATAVTDLIEEAASELAE
jgi:pimeloyl-ACP methyl ester carboxylesterase